MNEESSVFFEALKSEQDKIIRQHYEQYASSCLSRLVKQLSCSKEDAIEAYNYAFMVTWENIRTKKLASFTAHPTAYIVTIAKRQILKKKKKIVHTSEVTPNLFKTEEPLFAMEEFDKLELALNELGEPCKSIIIARYYHKYSREEIVEEFDYKNVESAGTAIHRCKQRLSNLFFNL